MKAKRKIKVFLIHQWIMGDLQSKVIKWLSGNRRYQIVDYSYTQKMQIEEHVLIQDYSCGAMMESDIVIVLPDWVKDSMPNYFMESLAPLQQSSFRESRYLSPSSVYTEELQTLMYDICNRKPALVLGWNRNTAQGLGYLLAGAGGDINTNPWRFHYMGLDAVEQNPEILLDGIVCIIDNYEALLAQESKR